MTLQMAMVQAELDRQEALKESGKFKHTGADMVRVFGLPKTYTDFHEKLQAMGSVSRAYNDHIGQNPFHVLFEEVAEVEEAIYELRPLSEIEEELIQVAAVCLSIAAGIDWERHRVGSAI